VKIDLFAFRLGKNWRESGPASFGDINDESATLVSPHTLFRCRWPLLNESRHEGFRLSSLERAGRGCFAQSSPR